MRALRNKREPRIQIDVLLDELAKKGRIQPAEINTRGVVLSSQSRKTCLRYGRNQL